MIRLGLPWTLLLGDSYTVAPTLPDSSLEMLNLSPNLPYTRPESPRNRKVKKHHPRQRRSPRSKPGAILVSEDAQKRRNQKKSDEYWSVRQTESNVNL